MLNKSLRPACTLAPLAVGFAAHAAEPDGEYTDGTGVHMVYEVHREGAPIPSFTVDSLHH